MKFFKGLHRDNHPADQPEGTYRDARNIVLNEQRGAVSNEEGNEFTSSLPAGYHPIGKVNVPDGRIVLFLSNGIGGSEIGELGISGKYRTLLNDPQLNFSLDYPVQATIRMIPERIQSSQVESGYRALQQSFKEGIEAQESSGQKITFNFSEGIDVQEERSENDFQEKMSFKEEIEIGERNSEAILVMQNFVESIDIDDDINDEVNPT